MAFELLAYQNRTEVFQGQLFQKDGTPYAMGPFDKLRFKMGRGTDIPLILDILSDSPTAAGSFIQIMSRGQLNPPLPAQYQVQIAEGDVATTTPGAYDGEVSVVLAMSGLIDLAEIGIVHVIATVGGAITLT
jgi:hypothetical protein